MEHILKPAVAAQTDLPRLWEARHLPDNPAALADERYHDIVAETYDDWEGTPWMAHAEAWIVPWMVGHVRGGIAVDLGTGTGRIAQALAETGSVEVIAVDRSRLMLQATLAKTKGLPVLALRADAADLPILDATVDAVTCSGVLHHIEDPRRAINEVARVLRPGGLFVIREPNADYPAKWFAPLERMAKTAHGWWLAPPATETCEASAPSEQPVSPALLRDWLSPMFVPESIGSAKLLASLSLPVGTWGEHLYYRLANLADRACVLKLLRGRGSLVLVVARRTE
ncbi:class I SAM-dependent methyltransferase [Streptomyces sp. NPDC088789]|uniref:class I SAM-dependent methyltransferase n=1 Tax=Streptomyces sp. NPDC088789 TaxID=3365899 RepID=UPI003825EDE4